MRGDLLLNLRVVLRPRGVTGLIAGVVGLIAAVTVYLPWYEIRAEVTMLGSTRARTVAELAGWEAHPWLWVVAVSGAVAAVVGIAIAVDRPPPRSRDLLVATGIVLALTAGLSALVVPPTARFGAGETLAELGWLAERVPDDIAVELYVRPAVGLWIALATAALLLTLGVLTRER